MTTPTITDGLTITRAIANPVAADPDWRATNDVATFVANSGVARIVPDARKTLGWLDLMIEFVNAAGNPVNVANNTTVDMELLQVATPRLTDGRQTPAWLVNLAALTLRGETSVGTTRPIKAPMDLGVRIVATANLPAGYQTMYIIMRYY